MKTFLFLLVSILVSGCTCTMEKAEKMVGACEKQKEIIEGPPTTIFIRMPMISSPPPVALVCETWTEDMIREDPVGYEEVLISDLLRVVGANISVSEYLDRLEIARLKLEAAANNPEEPPE